ncbi:putative zinc-binding metallopeptidase [Myroides odoratus]|uniref:Zinc-binding metallopeptidase n=1 Tax=Myroides odoratus TaxID=256 RepID=A0A9Q6Z3F4_MYROD|nr:putative zinc-binding metallopeptidase [Myroides odoratus]EHQ42269.1 hypothetical protein Myrod_1436 [Myroides odoratus DSM 2801]EKB09441.1 hypothetical protein HMPREF9716_00057 [Myroides odoratus CIP 103059]QQT99648.1 putative zinc-binding metallopeptidase [Myroides odoratus]WQD58144.1 putative zinc-binding metallopeptidase [Myroides odoratus]STZ29529.1 Uncharacterised protein [Myroides odoratus]
MKNTYVRILSLFAFGFVLFSCNNDDKLDNQSYLPEGPQTSESEVDEYLYKTFTEPYNMRVHYKWDRNIYGSTTDNTRNLNPPRKENVIPAFEMVNHVWLKTYDSVAGKQFVKDLRPMSLLAAGGYAFNENGTRTLGLASGGVQITLYEVDYLRTNVESAKEFIHTIQHEYIHIINQKEEFNQPNFGKMNLGDYTPSWYQLETTLDPRRPSKKLQQNGEDWNINAYANVLGFVTGYSRSNIIEDFAEVASYYLTTKPEDVTKMLDQVRSYENMTQAERDRYGLTVDIYKPGGVQKILYKYELVKEYFWSKFKIDFEELVRVANLNAASSPMLNGGVTNTITFEKKTYKTSFVTEDVVRHCQLHADVELQLK